MSLHAPARHLVTAVLAAVLLATALVATAASGAHASPAPPRGDSGPALTAGGARIVGGAAAVRDRWPSQVALLASDTADGQQAQFCGGTLIAARWVLTAGHCLGQGEIAVRPADVQVAVGIEDLSAIRPQDRVDVVEVFRHPQYLFAEVPVGAHDAALLHLAAALPGPYAPLVGQDQQRDWGVGSRATVTGWGATAEAGERSDHLRRVDVPVIADRDCARAYPGLDQGSVVCAGFPQGTKDSCQGDSGGPLWTRIDGRPWQIGIVSGGLGCARPGFPGGYGEVAAMRSWIVQTIVGRHEPASMS